MSKLFIFTLFLISCPTVLCIDARIPKHILDCYRKNMTEVYNNIRVPLTMNVLIELLQKVEMSKTLDLRLLTNSVLYEAKFDGIQRSPGLETENIVPVGPSAIHFKKFKLLLNYFLSGNADLFPSDSLTKTEFCTLHRMISSSVQGWQRGDEFKSCPEIQFMSNNGNLQRLVRPKKSSCPIEKGTIKSKWGDISAGHLLLSVSAALQNQDVKLMQIVDLLQPDENIEMISNGTRNSWEYTNEDINNLWAVTFAGELGEIVAYQALYVDKLIIGTQGTWNDSLLPQALYLPDHIGQHWEMTRSETLGSMDGAIIGNQAKSWTSQTGRIRLSQILDMYYSRRGTHFDEKFRACQRKNNIKNLLEGVDLVKQTSGMAKLLQYYYQSASSADEWVPIPEEDIDGYVKRTVNEFIQNIDALTDGYSACEKGYDVPPLDIFLVIDGTFTPYEGRRLIGGLVEALDVSRFGSRLGVISGNRGIWMTNFTNSIYQIFEDLSENDHLWPHSLSLPESLSTINEFLLNKTEKECMDIYHTTRSTVIVIISPSSSLTSTDVANSLGLIKNIKQLNPSNALLYITSEQTKTSYDQLTQSGYLNDKIILAERRSEMIVDKIAKIMENVPGQIVKMHCDCDKLQYEDYVIPNVNKVYEIPFTVLQVSDLKIEFSGQEYGNLSICASDKAYPEHKLCQWLDERNSTVSFQAKALCKTEQICDTLFRVNLVNSRNKCTDDECRYPNQGRIQILTTWSSSTSINSNFMTISISLIIVFLLMPFSLEYSL